MELLRRSREEAAGQQTEAMARVAQQALQLEDNERLYRQRLDTARAELEALHNELTSRKEVIRNANEAIFMKVSRSVESLLGPFFFSFFFFFKANSLALVGWCFMLRARGRPYTTI